ncbi:glycosyltransferase family 1 protein [Blastococcus sp. CT_GayMR20]|nr:glycosyltransferase family 1 protein [Blastococcus sp. CT_GayMR20]
MTVEQLWQPVPGGSATYIRELVREYAAMPDLTVTGVAAWHRGPAPEGLDLPLRRLPLPRVALYEAWQRARRPRVGRGADVVHATTWAAPGARVPLVVTVHDLAFLDDPGHFTPRGVRFFRRGLEIARDEAAAVIVPSHATRDDCVAAGIAEDRLHVVPHGVRRATVTPAQVTEFLERHGLERPYVLWAGTREPRKNLPTLVAAFGRLLDTGADLDLVLAGPEGWGPEQDRLAGGQGERVRLLGRLSRPDLEAAYAGARVFCYPSLKEGYGMPVTEAMAHGTPVVTSRGTATEEAAGGAAVLVDPHDAVDVARGLAEAADDARNLAMRHASSARAEELDWGASARATAGVLRSAAAVKKP